MPRQKVDHLYLPGFLASASVEEDVSRALAACLDVYRAEIPSGAALPPPYAQLPLTVSGEIDRLQREHGEKALAPFYCALLRLMSAEANLFPLRFGLRLTEEITRLRSQSLQRIRAHGGAAGEVSFDMFLKDMAICRGIMFPAGARVVEVSPGFPRKLLLCAGPTQAVRFMQLLMRMRGNGPCYQVHVHLSELQEFGPSGWRKTLVRLGEMLRLNMGIRGVFGSAWFYDPVIADVSPNLAYLRHIALETGAQEFIWGIDKSSNAFVRSENRRRMFASGTYVPRVYYLIWPRERLIELSLSDGGFKSQVQHAGQ